MFSALASSYVTRACVSTFVKQIAKPTRGSNVRKTSASLPDRRRVGGRRIEQQLLRRRCSAKSVNKQIEDLFAPEHGAFTGEGLRDQKSRPGGDRYARFTTNTRFRDTGNRTDLCAVCNR
jgi:hypothetical protein